MDPYRVLVVDDSAFMRKIITDLIEKDSQFKVIGTAVNGIEAVASVERLNPDVITLDLEMPLMNGIDALQHILKKHKLPIIMLSGISEANTRDTIKALQFGAFDFIRKPTSVGAQSQDINSVGDMILEKLKIAVLTRRKSNVFKSVTETTKGSINLLQNRTETASNLLKNDKIGNIQNSNSLATSKSNIIEKKTKPIVKKATSETPLKSMITPNINVNKLGANDVVSQVRKKDQTITQIVAIGTSTGGPRALHEVISALPGTLRAPVVIVQHMPPRFTKSLAQRLDSFSELSVMEASQGMKLENGNAYVAPGGYHMEIVMVNHHYEINLTSAPARNGHRPSVDTLFDSLLPFYELERHIVIMTGMGSDGAQGMKQLFDQGVTSTIAEAEESCIVYGMPRSAVELGVANKVLPLIQIAPEIINVVMR
ncbi:protein-glutamate methylesterase/protein-glutamine glutaminase [Paenibacillus endoradicis]|uniref:protein-glutamate methylesterase/protein-glutamine glutaminase n=1 Tax=Paenibacillus endoradicis TaxID=2972487 RepID=UPI0021593EB6|nr:chemotaxis response regulator protein-glutamate methylesterase [Paenibacillus endoradicis]MCR8656271.1 chemotaxis response regulator protein-glutamate methylesterase [Paenibacillus endoradicis]